MSLYFSKFFDIESHWFFTQTVAVFNTGNMILSLFFFFADGETEGRRDLESLRPGCGSMKECGLVLNTLILKLDSSGFGEQVI